jgi:4-hydroxyphenylpyruvate dioxygenase
MTTSTNKESLGIQRISSLHMFVRDLERSRDHYIRNLDFLEIARSTPEYESEERARASVVQAGHARFVFIEPLGSRGESFRWLQKHPEGVGRIVFDVNDAEHTFALLNKRGATPITGLERRRVEGTEVTWFDIATPIGDTTFRFISHPGDTPILPNLERVAESRMATNRFGIGEVDHVTSNFLTLKPFISWLQDVLGFEMLWNIEFHTQDVKKGHFEGSGLKSIVMWDPASGVKFANNEPAAPFYKASQIFLFCEDHRGAGVQHVALTVDKLIDAVTGMSERRVGFMPTPAAYYDLLPERLQHLGIGRLDEDVETLRRLGILVDGAGPGQYLLQIFMQEAASLHADKQAGPLFLELIQRKGDNGFGAGNFRALFDSIERQQQVERTDL